MKKKVGDENGLALIIMMYYSEGMHETKTEGEVIDTTQDQRRLLAVATQEGEL